MKSRGRSWWTATIGSACLVVVSTVVAGCIGLAQASDDEGGVAEVCAADVRNDEWGVDCSAACNHVMTCKASTGDSDLTNLSCGDCLGSCVAGVVLGGNDLAESTDEDRRSWECAELVTGCDALDHNCDLY